jgi:hypothetical protein
MEDIIDIIVTETTNTIEITSQSTDEVIDVNIIDNREDIVLNVTPTVVEININSLTGNFGVAWGEITGTLSAQTDLNTALGLKADLVGGKVPSSQLPSYVDDVVEVANYAALPATGETGKIYVVLDTNKIYRWSGSAYVEIVDSAAVWGAITGTLSSQTDLQSALNAKFDDPTGDTTQYIAGDGSLITFPVAGQAGTLVREVRNTTGATLTKGTIVYISGATGNKPTVSKALATGDSTSAQTFGMVQANISNNANGYVVCVGDITGLDTSALTEGAQLYLSSTTAGTYTTTKQLAPAHLVYIGIVTRAHPTLGQIEVKIQNGYELDEIHDVAISSVANNQGIFWESSTSLWKNKSIATVLGYTPEQPLTFNTPLSRSTNTVSIPAATSSANGYLTSTDWSTFNGKQNALTNPVTGTGTSGIVAKFNGTSTLTDSIIYDNGTRVSIGADVTTSNKFTSVASTSSSYAVVAQASGAANGFWATLSGTGEIFRGQTSGGSYFIINNGGNAFLNGNLNVGDFASTSYRLNVVGTGNFTGALTGTSATFTGSVTAVGGFGSGISSISAWGSSIVAPIIEGLAGNCVANYNAGGTTPEMYFVSNGYYDGTNWVKKVASGSTQMVLSGVNQNILFQRSASASAGSTISWTPLMYINAATGNLGIGTTSPTTIGTYYTTLELKGKTGGTGNEGGYYLTSDADGTTTGQFGTDGNFVYIGSRSNTDAVFTTNNTERMRITSGGNVLIGTTTDNGYKFNLAGNLNVGFGSASGYLQVTSSGQTTPGQVWASNGDNAGLLLGAGVSGGYVASIQINGNWNGSSATGGDIIMKTTSTERMRITSGGQLLVGTTSAIQSSEQFGVVSSSNTAIFAKFTGGATSGWAGKFWNSDTTGNNLFIEFQTETSITARGSITYNRGAGITVYNTTSDYRLKSELEDFNALQIIDKIYPKKFRIGDAENKSIGFIAHELQEYMPQAVHGEKDAVDKNGKPIYQGVDYSQLTGLLTQAIKELKAELDTLKNK